MKDLHCLKFLYVERFVNSYTSYLTFKRLSLTFKVSVIIFKFLEKSTLKIDITIKMARNSLNLQMTISYPFVQKQMSVIRLEFILKHSKESNATKVVSLLFQLFWRRIKL